VVSTVTSGAVGAESTATSGAAGAFSTATSGAAGAASTVTSGAASVATDAAMGQYHGIVSERWTIGAAALAGVAGLGAVLL
jgi:hypothetical protein